MGRDGGVRGRRGVITQLKAHYQCDIGYHGSTGYHGSIGYHGSAGYCGSMVTMVVLVTMVIEVAPVTSAPGCKAIVTFNILYRKIVLY